MAYNSAGTKTASAQRTMAYRAGGKTIDPATDKPISFANKKGVAYTELLLPKGVEVPAWAKDRWSLAAMIEQVEKRKDARFFKELELNLPIGLTEKQRIETAIRFVREQAVDLRGIIGDVAYHRYGGRKKVNNKDGALNEKTAALVDQWKAEGLLFIEEADAQRCDTAHVMVEHNKRGQIVGYRAFQPHMHVLLTLRKIHQDGFDHYRETWLNQKATLLNWREKWDEYLNEALTAAGRPERVDHRTLYAQKTEPRAAPPPHPSRIPLPGHHIPVEYVEHPYGHYADQRARSADTHAYNSTFDVGALAFNTVMGYMEGGVVGAVEAGVAGLLPDAAATLGSIPKIVINYLHGRSH